MVIIAVLSSYKVYDEIKIVEYKNNVYHIIIIYDRYEETHSVISYEKK